MQPAVFSSATADSIGVLAVRAACAACGLDGDFLQRMYHSLCGSASGSAGAPSGTPLLPCPLPLAAMGGDVNALAASMVLWCHHRKLPRSRHAYGDYHDTVCCGCLNAHAASLLVRQNTIALHVALALQGLTYYTAASRL